MACPSSGDEIFAIIRNNVDLPAPFLPSNASVSPGDNEKEISFKTGL
jgi:hypothetical protein